LLSSYKTYGGWLKKEENKNSEETIGGNSNSVRKLILIKLQEHLGIV
jgi:hypothetical protein